MRNRNVKVRRVVEAVALRAARPARPRGVVPAARQLALEDEVELLRRAGGDPVESIRLLAATYSDGNALRCASLDTIAALFRRIHAFATLIETG
jgi:hypothetical protein